ncbi:MAG: AsmA family protein [Coxiellaceae bacterium]|nr:MAG: AsmA family protein [Coxiellaceae bacterium]
MLRGLHGNGGLQIGNLKVSGLSASNVNLQLNADNDVIHFSPIAANLYGGKSNGDITIDMRSQQPKLSINEALQAIQVGNLFQDVANKSKLQVTGTGDLRFNLQTSGQDAKTLTRNLNGNLKFAVTNGSIKNLNLNRALQTALSAINKTSDDKADSNTDNDTSFSSFTGTAVITNGIATNNDLSLKSNSLEMSGNGTANLIDQSFNYHLKVIALGSPFGRDVIDFQQRIGGSFPLLLTGNFNNPKILPDLSTIGQGLLKGEFRQKLEKLLALALTAVTTLAPI